MKKLVRYSGLVLALAFASISNAEGEVGHGLTLAEAQKWVSGFSSSVDTTAKTANLKGSIAKDCVQNFKLESDARVASDNWVRFALVDVTGEGMRCLEIYRDVCPGDKCVSFDALSSDPKTNTKFRSSIPLLDSELTRAKVGLVAALTAAPPSPPERKAESLEANGACVQCRPAMGKTNLDESTKPMTDIVARGLHGLSKSKKMRDGDDEDDRKTARKSKSRDRNDADDDDDRPSRKKTAKKSRSKSRDDDEDDDDDDDDSSTRIAKRKKSKDGRYELVDQSKYRQQIQSIMFQGQGQGAQGMGGGSGLNTGLGYQSVLSNAFASPYASMMGMGQPSALGNPYASMMPNASMSSPSAFSMMPNYSVSPNYSLSSGAGSMYGLQNMSAFFGRGY